MSYFGKVRFGNDSKFEDADDVADALKDAGYSINERPENGEIYFSKEGKDE